MICIIPPTGIKIAGGRWFCPHGGRLLRHGSRLPGGVEQAARGCSRGHRLSAGPEANIGLAFVTGLTTGGLSCLAVQAGLLAASVAQQAETDVAAELAAKPELRQTKRVHKKPTKAMRLRERQALALLERPAQESRRHRALPIALFLGS